MTRTDELRKEHTPRSARELLTASLGSDPWATLDELDAVGKRMAEAEGVAYQLEHERKTLLATLATEYARAHADQKMSEAKLERLARADDRYRRHIEGTAEAIAHRERTKAEYWALKSELEWDATAVRHLNASMRLD